VTQQELSKERNEQSFSCIRMKTYEESYDKEGRASNEKAGPDGRFVYDGHVANRNEEC